MKISIITVCKNCINELEKTITSVISQKEKGFEYIVIDGASSDGTLDVIEKYSDCISLWISESDSGIYNAMNKGIKNATGDYVIFMNAGDWFEEDALVDVSDYLSNNAVDILYGKVNLIMDNKPWGMIGIIDESLIDQIYIKNIFCHQGMVIKKKLFDELGQFDESYRVLADYDWNLKAYTSNKKIALIDKTIANFLYGGTCTNESKAEEYLSIASKYTAKENTRIEIIKKIYNDYCEWDEYKKGLKTLKAENEEDFNIPVMPNMSNKYIVWGSGVNGEESYLCLSKMGREILFFIDADEKKLEFHGLEVKRKEQVDFEQVIDDESIGVCISTTKYEDEIKKELSRYDISEDRIISFREIRRWIGNFK